jgi:uncharacterized protein (TIGR02271 family)
MADMPRDRVIPLDDLDDYQVAEGDPDVRGWDVIASDGRKIGEVDQLLVDPQAMKVRYLDVDLDDGLVAGAANEDRHVLIPIGYARLEEAEDQIRVDSLASSQISTLLPYNHEPIDTAYEADVRRRFDSGFTDVPAGEDFYAHEGYDENRFFGDRRPRTDENEERLMLSEEELDVGRREVKAGEVEIGKHVETEHVTREVPLRHEEVTVERRPADPGMSASPRIEEGEIHIPVTEEEAVVNKRIVPKEEIVVRKREVVDDQQVEADLRRERVDVNEEGKVDLRREGRDEIR